MSEPKLLVLAGYPRSGTTWLSNVINSSPQVIYRHEYFGRLWAELPGGLFDRLKHSHGLSDADRRAVVEAVLTANFEADRPPFFGKEHLLIANPRLHQLAWMGARALPRVLAPLYRVIYRPRSDEQVLLIKETRSAVNMDSILTGLKPHRCIFLFRHPCGAIASQLRGISSGNMTPPSRQQLEMFHADSRELLQGIGVADSLDAWLGRSIETQLAAMWSAQNIAYLHISDSQNAVFIDYEAFYAARHALIDAFFAAVDISLSAQTEAFLRESDTGSQSVLKRDASSEFYSVYRDSGFDPQSWRKQLQPEQITTIEDLTSATYARLQASAWTG